MSTSIRTGTARGRVAERAPGAGPPVAHASAFPVSPCHGERCRGGPARVWCPVCGRSFQADDVALTRGPGHTA